MTRNGIFGILNTEDIVNYEVNIIMRRIKLGDVFSFKTNRGYRIIQWAYQIEKFGKYVKVFNGFYNEKPDNLTTILQQKCSYIIIFDVSQLFKKGILEYWGNYNLCIREPFPRYDIGFRKYGNQILFRISNSMRHQENEQYIGDSSGAGIPEKYKNVCLLNSMPHPVFFLYLLSSDFDLNHFDLYWPMENEFSAFEQKFCHLL